jgi:hypothetical protein
LIKTWEKVVAEKWLQMAENVRFAIFCISEVMETCTVSDIIILKMEIDGVFTLNEVRVRKVYAMSVEFDVAWLAIDNNI